MRKLTSVGRCRVNSMEPTFWRVTIAKTRNDHVVSRVAMFVVKSAHLMNYLRSFNVPERYWRKDFIRFGNTLVRWDLM